jgi:outer membrane autotransporter protein
LTIEDHAIDASSLEELDSLDGEIGTAVQNPSFTMGERFYGALFSQLQRRRRPGGGAGQSQSAYRVEVAAAQPMFGVAQAPGLSSPSAGPRWNAWLSGFGASGSRDGDPSDGSARVTYRVGGGAAGADVALDPNLLVGAAVGGSGADFSLDGRQSSGTARTVFFGLYGSWTMGPLYVDAAASYGHGHFETSRIVAIPDIAESATAAFGGDQFGGRVELGWRFMAGRTELTPFADVTVQALHQDGYSESTTNLATGQPGILGLSFAGETTTSVRSFLGGQVATTFVVDPHTTVTPHLRLAWAHEFTSTRQVNVSFLSIPGPAFTELGARPLRDAAIVEAGVEVAIGRSVMVYAQFDGDLGGGGGVYAGSGGLRITW